MSLNRSADEDSIVILDLILGEKTEVGARMTKKLKIAQNEIVIQWTVIRLWALTCTGYEKLVVLVSILTGSLTY